MSLLCRTLWCAAALALAGACWRAADHPPDTIDDGGAGDRAPGDTAGGSGDTGDTDTGELEDTDTGKERDTDTSTGSVTDTDTGTDAGTDTGTDTFENPCGQGWYAACLFDDVWCYDWLYSEPKLPIEECADGEECVELTDEYAECQASPPSN